MELQHPVIHLNGSGKQHFLETYTKTRNFLYSALMEMVQNRPHMRDYYPLSNADEAFGIAQNEHKAREDKLNYMLEEYEVLIRAID